MRWVQSGAYDRIVAGEYVRRGQEPGWRDETDAATEHYTERFKSLMDEAAQSVTKLGEQAGDAADRLQEWLRSGRR